MMKKIIIIFLFLLAAGLLITINIELTGKSKPANQSIKSSVPIAQLKDYQSKRISSYDTTGGNADFWRIKAGETKVLADIQSPGVITHIWMTIDGKEQYYLRRILLRMYWDGEEAPSVEVPVGDFFGMGHAEMRNFTSAMLSMGPQDGKAFNCFFPMPFGKSARIEVENQNAAKDIILYFYIDYQVHKEISSDTGYFHTQWHRQNPTDGISEEGLTNKDFQITGTNTAGTGNYVILDAEGKGHYVGCHLDIHNLRKTKEWNWYGEGDDMIFIDGSITPTLSGTGTEDYFCTAWGPNQVFESPYYGVILPGGENYSGKITCYRYHITDPIAFTKSIKVTIEHGHANRRSDDYSSTAYWYQTEPHKKFPQMLPVAERLPRGDN
jgi:hypothetical protein